jgi:hypothetical protein
MDIMSQLMDDTGSVVVNIREKDFETAEREYRRLVALGQNFDNIVVDLELSETEMGEFNTYNKRNQELIGRLLDDSKRFEELKKLEIRYRDEKNPSALYSVTYEGEGLKTQIQEVTRQYDQQAPALTRLGQELNLNTTTYLQSVSEVESLAEETSSTQETRRAEVDTLRRTTTPDAAMPASVDSLTLEVQPEKATFGETLRLTSWLNGRFPGDQAVDVYLDGQRWASGRSDAQGLFAYDLQVEQLRPERHILYTAHQDIYSPLVNVTITPSTAELTIDAYQVGERNVSVSGLLTSTGGIPVAGAEVDVYLNNIRVMYAFTRGDGTYQTFLPLQTGTYTFRTEFSDTTFPLEATESTPVTVMMTGGSGGRSMITTIMIYATFLILFSMGAVIYYRHQRGREIPVELKNPFAFLKIRGRKESPPPAPPEPAAAVPSPPEEKSPPAVEEPVKTPDRSRDVVVAQYRQLVIGGDFPNAVQGLYLFLRDQLARKYRIRDHRSFTPRELWRLTNNKPCFGPFTKFVHQYEMVRYGGTALSPEESESLVRFFGETASALESGSD